ncbi:MAG: aminoacyl-tRNA hydrolase [Flavobacteriaceae bacterium]|nr:aminoacyl-tRNA hydrolase [Flavobacteriaceae bacterium]
MNVENLKKEIQFKAIRSSGAGGQHVNKVSSKIELTFNLSDSKVLSFVQKERLLNKLSNKINKENVLTLFCDESRSQHRNKEIAIQRFLEIIQNGLIIPKKRKPTKPSKASILKKAENKKKLSQKKSLRKKPDY